MQRNTLMSPRAHLVLRLSALFVLAVLAVWPRSRDRAALVATPAHLAATTAARLEVDLRGRAARLPELLVEDASDSATGEGSREGRDLTAALTN